MEKNILITLFFLLSALIHWERCLSQTSEISLELGYGSTTIEENSEPLVRPFSPYVSLFYHVGSKYTITTNDNHFGFFTGLTLDKKLYTNGPDWSIYYLKVPIGVQHYLGQKKFRFILGGGINTGFLLSDRSYRDFTFGTFVQTGPSYQVSDNYRLSLMYQANFDLTPMNVYERRSPGGTLNEYEQRGYDGFILLSLRRKINQNNP